MSARRESRALRAAENFRRKECFCGNQIPKLYAMAWCDACLDEFNAGDEEMRLFIRRKEVARGAA